MSDQPSVLVVDDDPGVLQSLELLLGDDCAVVVCDSPKEALDVATRLHFDVIVTDYRMPHMTGAEFAAALKERVTPTPYCLLLTGTPNEVKPSMPGATDLVMVLAKPFDPDRLLKLVLQVGRLGMSRRAAAMAVAAVPPTPIV
jgi:CheY-like chemotaxis protein